MPALLDFVQHRLRSHIFLELFDLGVDLGLDTQPVGDRGQQCGEFGDRLAI
jgi:hypothetical protein